MRDRDVFIERIPFRETRLFVKRNIEHRAAYRRLYPKLMTAGELRPIPAFSVSAFQCFSVSDSCLIPKKSC